MKKFLALAIMALLLSGCVQLNDTNVPTTSDKIAVTPEGKEQCKLLEVELELQDNIEAMTERERSIIIGEAAFQLSPAAGCYSTLAVSENDATICQEIEALDAKMQLAFPGTSSDKNEPIMPMTDTCYQGFAYEMNNPSVCDLINSRSLREYCRKQMNADVGPETAETMEDGQSQIAYPEITQIMPKLQGVDFADQAQLEVTRDANDLVGCLKGISNADLCYDAFARKFSKASLCSKIVDSTLKADCKAAIETDGE